MKINLGAGRTHIPGYESFDILNGQNAYPLALRDNSVDELRASHILEHFSFRQTANILKDWVRVLKPGGWLKIAVPDFRFAIQAYLDGREDLPIQSYLVGGQMDEYDFHKAIFDAPTLEKLMKEAALTDIQRWESEINDCARLPVSLNLMGWKPTRYSNPEHDINSSVYRDPEQEEWLKSKKCRHGVAIGRVKGLSFAGAVYHCPCCDNRYGSLGPNKGNCPTCLDDIKELSPVPMHQYEHSYELRADAPIDQRFRAFNESIKPFNQYSQFCEDSIIEAIFERIGTASSYCCEVGAADGIFFSNTRRLLEKGWDGLWIESSMKKVREARDKAMNLAVAITCRFVGVEGEGKLDSILSSYNAPKDLDLLSIDIDGQEYHIINSLVEFKPRVLIVEYDPDCDPMFIPPLNGNGQAGRLALRFACEARGYEVVCRTEVNLICVRRDLAYLLLESDQRSQSELDYKTLTVRVRQPDRNGAYFVAGRWYGEEDVDKGNIRKELVSVNIGMVMSTPRIGYLDSSDVMTEIALALRAPRSRGFGVFWHHALSRSINKVLAFRYPNGNSIDVIVTGDYDTFARPEDLTRMIQQLYENPTIDAIIPLEMKRGKAVQVLAGTPGEIDFSQPLFPAVAGHFGLTVFRRRVFERLPKPWFLEQPDADGEWGEGRTDPDIYFWRNFCDAGFKAALATGVAIGHREEVITMPKIVDGKLVGKDYFSFEEWNELREKERAEIRK